MVVFAKGVNSVNTELIVNDSHAGGSLLPFLIIQAENPDHWAHKFQRQCGEANKKSTPM